MGERMSVEEAVLHLRDHDSYKVLIRQAYLDADGSAAAARFRDSEEFLATWRFLSQAAADGPLLHLGAGRRIASFAPASQGVRILAVEPEASSPVGERRTKSP